jgi:hypothetical protein
MEGEMANPQARKTSMTYSILFRQPMLCFAMFVAMLVVSISQSPAARAVDEEVRFERQIAPLLRMYCAGCHNDNEPEGGFSVSSYGQLMKGSAQGAIVLPGNVDESSLLQLLAGTLEPKMPPEDERQPTDEEIDLLRRWIEQGAKRGEPMPDVESVSHASNSIPPAKELYVGAACGVGSDRLAIGGYQNVKLVEVSSGRILWEQQKLPGKVNQLRPSADGGLLVVSTGMTGTSGEVVLLDITSGDEIRRFIGNDEIRHSDSVYCASLSADGRWLASGSYDRRIILWDASSGEPIRMLSGHNGTIYDLDFDPSSRGLATASGDQTVKLWSVETGERLDTFGQPEGEMLCVRFSRDSRFVVAAGADRQIRQWRVMSLDKPTINPMLVSRFAHGAAIVQLQLIEDRVISGSSDRTIKAWGGESLDAQGLLGTADDIPVALCVLHERANSITVVDLLGNIRQFLLPEKPQAVTKSASLEQTHERHEVVEQATIRSYEAVEPNDTPDSALAVELPAEIRGVIAPANLTAGEDVDLIRFHATAGQSWIFEVDAARSGSPLDSRIEVLHLDETPVLQTQLQAVRESYFTFRGKDSSTSDDFRLHKWEDMELDEYLYSSGEVVRLWLYPRGPDSGFKVYPGSGSRYTYFGTTAVSHALGEPAYIVRELSRGEEPLPNGLPVFPIYFENDDDPLRRHGADSRLQFTAPETGEYLLRIRDARGFGGNSFTYRLSIRAPQPDFHVAVNGPKLSIPVGAGREWNVSVTRFDGMDAPITIELDGLPPGIEATNPLLVEADQISAVGTLYASEVAEQHLSVDPSEEAPQRKESQTFQVKLRAKSEFQGRTIEHELPTGLEVTVAPRNGLTLQIVQRSDVGTSDQETLSASQNSVAELELGALVIRPGETISARVQLKRNGAVGAISFGNEDSGRGLPHGAFIDNIGLNGLLIPEGQEEREFFITAAPKVPPGRYQFHLRCTSEGNPTSRPIVLTVLPSEPQLVTQQQP